MAIRVVDGAGQCIGLGRSTVRTAIKFFPWEIAHFGIWQWADFAPPLLGASS